jgi:hypothetical protein
MCCFSLCQEYQEYLNRLNGETEESSCAAQLEGELRQLQLEEAALMADLANLKAAFHIRIHIKAYGSGSRGIKLIATKENK